MSNKVWLDTSNITFPARAAALLLTNTASDDVGYVIEAFDEIGIGQLGYIEVGIDHLGCVSRNVSLANAATLTQWSDEKEVIELLTKLAPICPDGTYAECTTDEPELESTLIRYIISGDRVISDYPNVTWDDPIVRAREEATA